MDSMTSRATPDAAVAHGPRLVSDVAASQAPVSSAAAQGPTGDVDWASRAAVPPAAGAPAAGLLDEIAALAVAAEQLRYALNALTGEAILAIGGAFARDPAAWGEAFVLGFCRELWSFVTGLVSILTATAGWLAKISGCYLVEASFGLAEITTGQVINDPSLIQIETDACAPYRPVLTTLRSLSSGSDDILAGLADFLDHPIAWTSGFLDLAVTVVQVLAEACIDDGELQQMVVDYCSNPSNAGDLVGRVAANVVVSLIPEVGEDAEMVAAASKVEMAAEAAAQVERTSQVAPALSDAASSAVLEEILARLRTALRASRKRLNVKLPDDKYQVVRRLKLIQTYGQDAVLLLRERAVSAILGLHGKADTYKSLRALAAEANANSRLAYLLELERQGAKTLATAEVASHEVTMAEQVLDAAHLVDARFYDCFSEAARVELGWSSPEDMPAVLATEMQHRRSLPNYFEGNFGVGSMPGDLKEVESITSIFRDRLHTVKDGPAKGAIVITSDMKASVIFQAHLDIWKGERLSSTVSREGIPMLEALIVRLRAKGL